MPCNLSSSASLAPKPQRLVPSVVATTNGQVTNHHVLAQTQIKKILGECTRHLQQFCEKLGRLSKFFSLVYHHVDALDQLRVLTFVAEAETTKKMRDRLAQAAQVLGSSDQAGRYEEIRQRKLGVG